MNAPFRESHLFQILRRLDAQSLPLDLLVYHYFKEHRALGSKDRKFIGDTLYGMIRWKGLIDFCLLKQKKPLFWEGRYQFYTHFDPKDYEHLPTWARVSFPKTLFDLLSAQYGTEKALNICQVSNTQAPTTVRVNPLKTTREKLMEEWASTYEIYPAPLSPLGIHFKKREPLTSLPLFKEGFFEIQDEGSQRVAGLVRAEPGDHVLDFCAGSGGKSLAYGPLLENRGQLYLHDVRPEALRQAKIRLKRASLQNAQTLVAGHPALHKLRKKMDWVVVDVPCSGTGTLRRNPDIKEKWSPELLERVVGEQRTIFEKALSFVKPGGKILYATCSILERENEKQVEHFLTTYPLELVEEPFRSLPIEGGGDGFFAATLKGR